VREYTYVFAALSPHDGTLDTLVLPEVNAFAMSVFLAEVAQSGIFFMQGYTAEERSMLIGSFCPATLYPYAREAVSDAVSKGGFPQLLLQPINFDALYAQAQQERARGAAAPASVAVGGETH
jgi:preprotein translocase subunit SecB